MDTAPRVQQALRMPRGRAGFSWFRLDLTGNETLQEQIYAELRRAVEAGHLAPGSRVPSSRALAQELGVSRTTTLAALEKLRAEGYLLARRGSGMFTTQQPPSTSALEPARLLHPEEHPALSRRGVALSRVPPAATRLGGAPRAFRLGAPALDCFPLTTWSRLSQQRHTRLSAAHLDYTDPMGAAALREAIAVDLRTRGTLCDPDQVLIVAGAQRGLELVSRLLLDPDDVAWVEEPGYPGARAALLCAGARTIPIPVDQHGLRIESAIREAPAARLIYTCPTHQFPLGVTMSLSRRRDLLKYASRVGAWIIEDDYDCQFRHHARPVPCLHGLAPDGRVIYLGTFSKTLFPALRLGFVVVPKDLCRAFASVRSVADFHPPTHDQLVLAEFMKRGHYQRHLRRMRVMYGDRLRAFNELAQKYGRASLRVRPVHTGLHAVVDLLDCEANQIAEACIQHGVEVTPLSSYYQRPGPHPNALVMGFASTRAEAIEIGMQKLVSIIKHNRFRLSRRR